VGNEKCYGLLFENPERKTRHGRARRKWEGISNSNYSVFAKNVYLGYHYYKKKGNCFYILSLIFVKDER
jgi:hypothetical protein